MRRRKRRTKYDAFCTSPGRDEQITINVKLLDVIHESYGFSGDLIETIN